MLSVNGEVPVSEGMKLLRLRNAGNLVFVYSDLPMKYMRKPFIRYVNGFVCSSGRYGSMGCSALSLHPLEREHLLDVIDRLKQADIAYTLYTYDTGSCTGDPKTFTENIDPETEDVYSLSTDDPKRAKEILTDVIVRDDGFILFPEITIEDAIRDIAESLDADPAETRILTNI